MEAELLAHLVPNVLSSRHQGFIQRVPDARAYLSRPKYDPCRQTLEPVAGACDRAAALLARIA